MIISAVVPSAETSEGPPAGPPGPGPAAAVGPNGMIGSAAFFKTPGRPSSAASRRILALSAALRPAGSV